MNKNTFWAQIQGKKEKSKSAARDWMLEKYSVWLHCWENKHGNEDYFGINNPLGGGGGGGLKGWVIVKQLPPPSLACSHKLIFPEITHVYNYSTHTHTHSRIHEIKIFAPKKT